MKKAELPSTDSVQALAAFWDSHDVTDFEDQLEEVAEPVFARGTPIQVQLEPGEVATVQQLAQAKGVTQEELIRGWVRQRLARRKGGDATRR